VYGVEIVIDKTKLKTIAEIVAMIMFCSLPFFYVETTLNNLRDKQTIKVARMNKEIDDVRQVN
jgi:hypothetical protein